MQIFVRNLMGGGNFTLDVEPTDYVEIVKAKIQVRTNVFTAVFDNISYSRTRKESHTTGKDWSSAERI